MSFRYRAKPALRVQCMRPFTVNGIHIPCVSNKANVNERGFTLAGALTFIAVLLIFMALSVPLWSWVKKRDNEMELIFRGKEYVEAISRYHAKFGAYPPDLDTLYKLKFIRKLYLDPMTKSGKWKVLRPDSLVQTGAAGTINQPGQSTATDEGDDDEGSDQSGSRTSNQDQEDHGVSGDSEEAGESDEEPETEIVGPIVGVVSRSKKTSIKIYNGQDSYNKWVFVYAVPQQQTPQKPSKPGTPKPKPGTTMTTPPSAEEDEDEDKE